MRIRNYSYLSATHPPTYPRPLVHCAARTAGEEYSVGCLGRPIGIERGNATELRFFLLPYGVTAENQPFNDSLANDLLIDIKTNLLYYRMIILYIAIILAIIGRFCL